VQNNQTPNWPDQDLEPKIDPQTVRLPGTRPTIVIVVLLGMAVLCVAAFLAARVLRTGSFLGGLPAPSEQGGAIPAPAASDQPPTAGPTAPAQTGPIALGIQPDHGPIGALISVTGRGWWAGEPVFVYLRSPLETNGPGYSYAAALADDRGEFRTAVTFPNEARWIGQTWADVTARGTRSGLEATVRFTLEAPTATPTLALPTARPTVASTDTPAPTSTLPPTETPTPTPTPTLPPVITDWRGAYYANPLLEGEPALVRNDAAIDFDWRQDPPAPGLPADGFGARWLRQLYLPAGLYEFTPAADDGVRLWIDGKLLVDQWRDGAYTAYPVELALVEGSHALQMDYYERTGNARASLVWRLVAATLTPTPTFSPTPSQTPTPTASATPEPSPTPTHTPPPTPSSEPFPLGPWQGEYFGNPELAGQPVFTALDPFLEFDWGSGSPAEPVPADQFSVRWSQGWQMPAGTYRFSMEVDDGVRFWINDVLVVDEWHPVGGRPYVQDVYLPEGFHAFEVHYLELADQARIRFWVEALQGP
jgi:hypothetical protein